MRGTSRSKWSTTSNINQILNSTPTSNAGQTTTTDQAANQTAVADQTSNSTKRSTTNHSFSTGYSIHHRTCRLTKFDSDTGSCATACGADPAHRQIVHGYSELVAERMKAGWTCHLLTFLFVQLPSPRAVVINR